ncbi:MAG: hypothetical protein ACRD5W_11255 [Candidatus Acidiferrales bacterium]
MPPPQRSFERATSNSAPTEQHRLIVSSNPGAQREFERGLGLVYAFHYDQAISAFERSKHLDPSASMPHWGIALALGPSINDPTMTGRMADAHGAVRRALELAGDDTEQVRDYVLALSARYSAASDFNLESLARDYATAMRDLVEKYPADLDAATLFAESLILAGSWPWWTEGGKPRDGIDEAIRVVESVLARDPQHIGASHYHIHLLESSPTPERALSTARRLDKLAPPGAGHLLHMPSHIYMRLGDYRAAVASNLRAVRADSHHPGTHGAVGLYPTLQAHSREFLAAAAGMTGQFKIAREADDSLFVLLRFQQWDAVLSRVAPRGAISTLEWRVARVLALTAKGMLDEAEAELKQYEGAERALPPGSTWWADPIERFLPMVRSEMAARIIWARGDRRAAVEQWREAVKSQDVLTRSESVLPWFHPLRESLGAALYLNGQVAEAEMVFREDLRHNPNNPRSLFGLWQSLESQAKTSEARPVRKQFEDAWKDADVQVSMHDL